MTYEKAIDLLNEITTQGREADEAINMAIQALKENHYHHQIFEYCTDCKEYDREHHCCHRFTKVIGTTIYDARAGMTKDIIEQIEKMRQKEPYHFLSNLEAYNLFQKIVEDYRDGKGPWAERGEKDG